MHFAHLANTLLKDEESARDNHVLACLGRSRDARYGRPTAKPAENNILAK